MSRSGLAVATALTALLLLVGACRKDESTASSADAGAATARHPGAWRIVQIEADLVVADDQQVAGVDRQLLLEDWQAALAALPQVQGIGPPPPPGLPVEQQAGVHLAISWQLLDPDHQPRPVQAPAADGELVLAVAAHVEQGSEKGRAAIAERQVDVTVPVPAARMADLGGFLRVRLRQAVSAAVSGALGELLARGLPDAELRALLDDPALWKRLAAVREAGERRLEAARPELERAAGDSRKELAVVAAAALGRLGGEASLRALQRALESPHLEVTDAAMGALADIGTPAALRALRDTAAHHPAAVIRQRAEALLHGRGDPGPDAGAAP